MKTLLATCLLLALPARLALAETPGEPPLDVGVDEKLGQTVPLDLMLVDEQGERVSLRSLLDKPTLLTLNYFRCSGLCTPLLNGVAGQPVVMKEKHLRVMVRQNGRALALKAWNFAGRAGEMPPGARVDITFTLEEDAYSAARGYAAWAAVLRDVRAAKDYNRTFRV